MTKGPSQLFFATNADRAALAREQFFEEGQRPSGLVPEPVIQSWSRCMGSRRKPDERIEFEPISKTRTATVLTKNRRLLEASRDPLAELEVAIAGSGAVAMLTNGEGVVVHASSREPSRSGLMHTVARIGVPIGEMAVGTGAPGLAASTGEVAVVRGAEHFFRCMASLHCAAAPIRDASGSVVAVLDLSCVGEPFKFDAAGMALVYATSIENRLLADSARSNALLRFQDSPSLIRTPLEGLCAVDGSTGRVLWFNSAGATLLNFGRVPTRQASSDEIFGLNVDALMALAHMGSAMPRTLPTGLTVWMAVDYDGREASPEPALIGTTPPASGCDRIATPTSLKDSNKFAIEEALDQCHGNVSKAARLLGVSRGLLYRYLRNQGRDQ